MSAAPVSTTPFFLLARRPGWRASPLLSTGVEIADAGPDAGSLALAPLTPPSVWSAPPQGVIELPNCQRGVVDREVRRVLIVAGTGQIRLVIRPTIDCRPIDWTPVGLVFLPPDRLAVLDAAHVVHLVDCHGRFIETVADLTASQLALAGLLPTDPPLASQGTLVAGPFDSGVPGCRWHRIAITGTVPQGCSMTVGSFTTDLDLTEAELAALGASTEVFTPAGTFGDPELTTWDALIQSPPGQACWLRVELRGDGLETPRLTEVEIDLPRATSLSRLPAIFASGESDFLDRFLALTDTIRGSVTDRLDGLTDELDPRSATADPKHDFLEWLGGWVGMTGIGALPVARQRRLIAAAAELYHRRGTPDGVARHVSLWLGRRVTVLEQYRLRRWAVLNQSRLGDATELYGNQIVGRLQIGGYAPIGGVQIVSVPSPRIDPFRVFAHRFTLYVHACDGDDRNALASTASRVVAQIAPAHTQADVEVVTASARVGKQARLGIDCIVAGPPPVARLGDQLLGGQLPDAGQPGFTLGADPRAGGLSSIGIDARVGTRARIG